jgi:hypothetical protein
VIEADSGPTCYMGSSSGTGVRRLAARVSLTMWENDSYRAILSLTQFDPAFAGSDPIVGREAALRPQGLWGIRRAEACAR